MNLRTLTRTASDRLPDPVVTGARRAAHGWGRATASLRMLPEILVIGAQRSGTTTLYRVMSQHPDLVRPTLSKGIGYFDIHYGEGLRWYRGHFPVASVARARRPGGRAVAFESSGYYSFHPLAAGRIARDLPGVQVVMMVRDPVERAHSAYKHEFARGFETESFADAVDMEAARLDGEVERMLADPGYVSSEHRHHAYVGRGEYATQIERFQRELGRDRVHVVDADDFFAEPMAQIEQLTSWLGLAPWTPTKVEQWNARPGDEMSPELRQRLVEHFEPFDQQLEALTGRVPSWRRGS